MGEKSKKNALEQRHTETRQSLLRRREKEQGNDQKRFSSQKNKRSTQLKGPPEWRPPATRRTNSCGSPRPRS